MSAYRSLPEGEFPTVAYGEDGPIFARVCPECGLYVRAPEAATWEYNKFLDDYRNVRAETQCKRCGPVTLELIGWGRDFE